MSTFYHVAQPALLYLVPMTVLPMTWTAKQRGEMDILWEGNGLNEEEEDNDGEPQEVGLEMPELRTDRSN
jgi:hypothetical protein